MIVQPAEFHFGPVHPDAVGMMGQILDSEALFKASYAD
jgi:hypothetical protein